MALAGDEYGLAGGPDVAPPGQGHGHQGGNVDRPGPAIPGPGIGQGAALDGGHGHIEVPVHPVAEGPRRTSS